MINEKKWTDSLPKNYSKHDIEASKIDHDKWVNTIPKKNTYSSLRRFSLITAFFFCGFFLVSVVKNETRNLQKEINTLESSISLIKFNLNQAILDNEVITSPENIAKLAKEHLNKELTFYQKSQIKKLNDKYEKKIVTKKEKNLPSSAKIKIQKEIKKKKAEIVKLQKLYKNPEQIPGEIKIKVAKQIEEKKFELKSLYSSPKEVFTLERVGKWSAIQVVKLFLGMPVIPGR